MAVVLAAPFKSTVTAIQCAGRLRDSGTYFIELVDLSFQSLAKFYYHKLPTYNQYMLSVTDYNFSRQKLNEKAEDLEYQQTSRNSKVPIRAVDERFGIGIFPLILYTDDEADELLKKMRECPEG